MVSELLAALPLSALLYAGLIGLTAIERLVEVRTSKKNAAWSLARGGQEHGQGHYPFMVVLHTGFLFACVAEVWMLHRTMPPAVSIALAVTAILLQCLRWWCITTLGPRWNTRVIFVPGLPRVTGGPYRYLSHPNYVVVALEGLVLPLVHGAWLTALVFSILNAGLMRVRLRVENEALQQMEATA